MMRSIGAVLVGLSLVVLGVMLGTMLALRVALGGGDPTAFEATPTFLVANLVASALAAVVGGYVTGLLAGRGSMRQVQALAAMLLLMGVASLIMNRGAESEQPAWYIWVLFALGPCGVLLGGLLEDRRAGANNMET